MPLYLLRYYELSADYVCEVFLRHHGYRFVADGAPYVLRKIINQIFMAGHCRRVVSNGGWSTAQVGVGAVRASCCLLGPGCSTDFLLIELLPPLIDDAVSSSRAEVIDREDGVKHRFV